MKLTSKEIELIKAIQRKILIGMRGGISSTDGIVLNIFFNASEDFIQDNFEKAKEYYKYVFDSYVSTYCILRAKELGISRENDDEIIRLLKDGSIEPIPYYNELKDLIK